MLRDAPSVLDADVLYSMRMACIESISTLLGKLEDERVIRPVNRHLQAQFINGGLMDMALWIARSSDRESTLDEAKKEIDLILNGLKL
ncbi:hypothetical protein [Vibrio sonorensis]|uniref:hypothetical protein n=1 Tax=Vibrio sonorensis TaxID=1004316 RepID=UPI0008DAE83B|nr:hypothetical protein [Vibrio sonorensis]